MQHRTSLSEWSGGAGLDGGEGETCCRCRCCSSALGFLWPWQWIPSMKWMGMAWPGGQALILLLVLALALALVLALGPFPSSINSSTSSSILLLHPLTHLSPHFTSPSPPLFSLSLLSPSLSPFSSPLLVPLPHFSLFRLHFSSCWPFFLHASRAIAHPPPPPPLSHRSARDP